MINIPFIDFIEFKAIKQSWILYLHCKKTGWCFQIFLFLFTRKFVEDEPILTSAYFFKMGW